MERVKGRKKNGKVRERKGKIKEWKKWSFVKKKICKKKINLYHVIRVILILGHDFFLTSLYYYIKGKPLRLNIKITKSKCLYSMFF